MFKKVAAVAAVVALSSSVAFAGEFTVSNQFPPSHHISKTIHVFADKVAELTGGKTKVNVADSGALYSDAQILEAVQEGLVEVGLVGTYKWGGQVPAADVFDLPFLFPDLSSPKKFLDAGANDILDAEFNKKGVKNLFWCDYGFIQMWNNVHPLHTPKDFEGLTMRSYSAGDSITLKALGAAPTLISSAEMYMAIQQGTVKGATTGMPAAVSRKIYEVSKYLTIANYIRAKGSACEVWLSPFGVFLNADDSIYVEPDLIVVCEPDKVEERGCVGAPDWVVEVESPSSRKLDGVLKLRKYREAGVREYWIVHPDKRMIQIYYFGEDEDVALYSFDDEISSGIVDGLTIRLADTV